MDHTHDFLIALFVSLLMNVISWLPKINIEWFSLTKWSWLMIFLNTLLSYFDILIIHITNKVIDKSFSCCSILLLEFSKLYRQNFTNLAKLIFEFFLCYFLWYELYTDVSLKVLFDLLSYLLIFTMNTHWLWNMLLYTNDITSDILFLMEIIDCTLCFFMCWIFDIATPLITIILGLLDNSVRKE